MAVDFRSILDVYPDDPSFTCVGTTKQGRRCRNSFIKNAYLGEANKILDELPEIVGSRRQRELLPRLRRLAYLTLCPLWHQIKLPQVEPVAAEWLFQIQNLAVRRPAYALLTPPPTPPSISRSIIRQSIFDHPPPTPRTGSRSIFYQPAFAPSAQRTRSVPPSNMSPNRSHQYASSAEPNVQQSREHTSRTGRTVNITFNLAVDSNQIFRDHTRGTQRHDVTTDIPSPSSSRASSTTSSSGSSSSRSSSSRSSSSRSSSSRSSSSRSSSSRSSSSRSSSSRSSSSRSSSSGSSSSGSSSSGSSSSGSSSSGSSSSPRSPHTVEALTAQIIALQTQRAVLEHQAAQAQSSSSRIPEPEDPNDSDSTSSSDSGSDRRPSRSRARINTPSSSGSSSPVIVSPPRPSRSASAARSAAPSPSSAGSAVSVSVNRRPINADTTCYVCYNPIASEADAAWCRSSCGQNICLTCFPLWVAEQRQGGGGIVCGFCRAPWIF